MNIDNYLKQLEIDIDNQKLQKNILNKYSSELNNFNLKIKDLTQSIASPPFRKEVIDKLNTLIDSVTAMRIYNYLVSHNLINTFFKSYEYLLNYKKYNIMSYDYIINYILNFESSSKGMLDFLKDDLKEKLKLKINISQLKKLNKITENQNLKNKIKIASQKIPTTDKIDKIENIEILQQMINEADLLPDKELADKEQIDKIITMPYKNKLETEEEETETEKEEETEYSEKIITETPIKPKFTTPKIITEPSLEYSENIIDSLLSKKSKKIKPKKIIIPDELLNEPELQMETEPQQQYQKKYIDELNNTIEVDNKEINIIVNDIMLELNKKSQIEEREELNLPFEVSDLSTFEFKEKSFGEKIEEGLKNITFEEEKQKIEEEKELNIEQQQIEEKKRKIDSEKELNEEKKRKIEEEKRKIDSEKELNEEKKRKKYETIKNTYHLETLPTKEEVSIITRWKTIYKLEDPKIEWGLKNKIKITQTNDKDKPPKYYVEIYNPKTKNYIDYQGQRHKSLTKIQPDGSPAIMSPIIYPTFI